MKRFTVTLALLMVLGIVLAGCGPSAGGTVKTYTDPNQPITVNVGGQFIISISENPSTGYQWQDKSGDAAHSIVAPSGDEYIKPSESMPGKPGIHNFRFKGAKKGTASLTFELSRSWEKGVAPVEKKTFNVTVK